MDITIEELLNNSFVISIDDMRAAYFYRRFHDSGLIEHYPKLFRGYTMRTGTYRELAYYQGSNCVNCSRSHFDIVNFGKLLNLPFVCIFEDDAMPCKDIRKKLEYALTDIPDDASVIRLGWTFVLSEPTIDIGEKKIYDNAHARGSHAQIIMKNYYYKYRRIFENINAVADISVINSINAENGSEDGRILRIKTPLFVQKDAFYYGKNISGMESIRAFHCDCPNKDDFQMGYERQLSNEDWHRYKEIKERCNETYN